MLLTLSPIFWTMPPTPILVYNLYAQLQTNMLKPNALYLLWIL